MVKKDVSKKIRLMNKKLSYFVAGFDFGTSCMQVSCTVTPSKYTLLFIEGFKSFIKLNGKGVYLWLAERIWASFAHILALWTTVVRNLEKRRCWSQMMSISTGTKTVPIHAAAGKKSQMECVQCRQTDSFSALDENRMNHWKV